MKRKTEKPGSRGFTLIEMLVVTGIIALLVSLLVPAIQQAREAARRTQCRNNLKQIGLAMFNYESAYLFFPNTQGVNCWNGPEFGAGTGCLSTIVWCTSLLPFMDQANVYNLYDMNAAFYDPANTAAISTVVPTFLCPSTPRSSAMTQFNMTTAAIAAVYAGGNWEPYVGPASAVGGAVDYSTTNSIDNHLLQMLLPPSHPLLVALDGRNSLGWNGGWLANTTVPDGGVNYGAISSAISDITDGTSSTTMIAELAGRSEVYRAGFKNAKSYTSQAGAADDVLEIENQLAFGGGVWADPNNGEMEISGRQNSDGSGNHPGLYLINKSNMRSNAYGGGSYYDGYACGPYSFHVGGAHVLMCDGTVRMLSENMDPLTLCAIVGATDGLIVGEY